MKKPFLLWFAVLAFLMLGCRNETIISDTKNESLESEFFKNIEQRLLNNPQKNSIINRLKKENEKSNFIQNLNNHNGKVYWKKINLVNELKVSKTSKGFENEIYINIPFSDNSKLTSVSFLKLSDTDFWVKDIDNSDLEVLIKNDSIPRKDREELLINYLLLDKMIFNTEVYKEIPSDLFPEIIDNGQNTKNLRIKAYHVPDTTSNLEEQLCLEVYTCEVCPDPHTFWVCVSAGGGIYTNGGTTTGSEGGGNGGNGGNGDGGGNGGGTTGGNNGSGGCKNKPFYKPNPCDDTPQYILNFENRMSNFGFDVVPYRNLLMNNDEIYSNFVNYL